ncbi:MAG: acetyltransferase [Ruminococcus sp.]|nr:acetyltransferase [Ruminococcus sp.]
MKKLVIIGASGHGKVVADIARLSGYKKIVFLDDNKNVTKCGRYEVVGTSENIGAYNCDFFVAIGNPIVREKVTKALDKAGKKVVTLIHPNATIGDDVSIGDGSVVMAGAVINPCTTIGKGCIINTCSSVDHDSVISDYAHIAVGAHLAGTVEIGEKTWLGSGAVVSNNITISSNCIIGAGAVVIDNLLTEGTYVGVPARWLHK